MASGTGGVGGAEPGFAGGLRCVCSPLQPLAIIRPVKRVAFIVGAAAAAAVLPFVALADGIYTFRDENGVVHFTNIKGLDPRQKLLYPSPRADSLTGRSRHASMPTKAEMDRYRGIVDSAAQAYGVDPHLVHAVIAVESAYNAAAISPKGASGLMQLMPDTARRYGVRNIFDPAENIHGGVRYLRDLLAMFNNDAKLALAGYNAGENAVIRAGNRVPPYAETIAYVPKVIDLWDRLRTRAG